MRTLRWMKSLHNRHAQLHENADYESSHSTMPKQTLWTDLKALIKILAQSWIINSMLFVIPLALAAHRLGFSASIIFTLNCIAIIPLANLIGIATEDISLRLGESIGGLLNATFGNSTELIIAIFAINKGLIYVVQSSLLGSVLSNILLVLGCSFLFGGLYYKEQQFNQFSSGTSSTLLLLSCLGLVIPTMYHVLVFNKEHPYDNPSNTLPSNDPNTTKDLLLSRIISIILMICYMFYLFFQLYTHKALFETIGDGNKSAVEDNNRNYSSSSMDGPNFNTGDPSHPNTQLDADEDIGITEHEEPIFSMLGSIILLLLVTLTVALCSEHLTDSLKSATSELGLSEAFVGIILLPLIGNAAEHASAVTVALKNKIDLSIGISLGSSIQIALFAIPAATLYGWAVDKPMNLNFKLFDTILFLPTVFIVNFVLSDGKSNWFEGAMLIMTYLILAIACFLNHVE